MGHAKFALFYHPTNTNELLKRLELADDFNPGAKAYICKEPNIECLQFWWSTLLVWSEPQSPCFRHVSS